MPLRNIPNNLETLGDYVRWAASRFSEAEIFFGHGSDNALDEAFHLLTAALHLPHDLPGYLMNSRLTDIEKEHIFQLIQRRVTRHIPVPYLVNQAWFCGLSFFVDERVLIPRSPIAELIQSHFSPWIEYEAVNNILDICTGSGCIAIACAASFPDARCTGTDISGRALQVATRNVETHHLENRVDLIQSDLLVGVSTNSQFDIIVCNPPYVDAQCMHDLPPEYSHEPRIALEGGGDGLAFVKRLLNNVKQYLSPDGILVVEVGNSKAALIAQYPDFPFCWINFEHGGEGVFLLTRQQLG